MSYEKSLGFDIQKLNCSDYHKGDDENAQHPFAHYRQSFKKQIKIHNFTS